MMMAQGGVSLPAGYTKIEYLESDGTQFIDTGFVPNNNTKVVIDAYVPEQETGPLFGARGTGSPYVLYYRDSGKTSLQFGNNMAYITTMPANQRIVVTLDRGKITGDDVVYGDVGDNSFQSSVSLCLFYDNFAYKLSARIYSCKVYDNGVLIRDFIPCTNPDGISGLWDSVNDVFYTMLHAGYTKLDFIETDGTTYIDTGFKPNQKSRIKLDIQVTKSATSFLFGARANSSANSASNSFSMPQISGSSLRMDYGSKETSITISPLQRLDIDVNKNVVTINGNVTTVPWQTFQSQYSLFLLSVNTAGALFSTHTAARIYSCQIYDNDTLVRDFIPAMNASGEAGLLDLKNDVWYALKSVFTKVENKISVPSLNDTIVSSAYKVTSNILVRGWVTIVNLTLGLSGQLVGGCTIRAGYREAAAYPDEMPPEGMDVLFTAFTITSISPTEDDTYIYTF